MRLQVGQLVLSSQGRDADRPYLVISIVDECYVLVSDGSYRPLSKPKMKNNKHLSLVQKFASQSVINRVKNKKATDEEVRAELDRLMNVKEG